MLKNNFTSELHKDRIEVYAGLFSYATILNNGFCFKIQGEGLTEKYFNFFDYEGIYNYLFDVLTPKSLKKKLEANSKKKIEFKQKFSLENLHPSWSSLISKVDPQILAIHKMNFHSTGFKKRFNTLEVNPELKLIYIPELYDDKYLVEDLKKYRAAHIAIQNIDYLILIKYHLFNKFKDVQDYFYSVLLSKIENKEITAYYPGTNNDSEKNSYQSLLLQDLIDAFQFENILNEAKNWMCLFSDNGKTYRALNTTLMNLAPQIPENIVCLLPNLHIHKPLTDKLEFLLYFLSNVPIHQKIYKNSNSNQIKKAFKIYCENQREKITYSTLKINNFLMFLDDYRYEYHGNIIDLTKRVIKWHNDYCYQDFEFINNPDEEAAKPPIPLPSSDYIRFLSTAREIIEEGKIMKHCVSTYIEKAIKGQCYLFHIEYNGEKATAEIDTLGFIKQIKGVENIHNKACDFGMLALKEWSIKLNKNNNQFKYVRTDPYYPF